MGGSDDYETPRPPELPLSEETVNVIVQLLRTYKLTLWWIAFCLFVLVVIEIVKGLKLWP